jgi:hypothetical protein
MSCHLSCRCAVAQCFHNQVFVQLTNITMKSIVAALTISAVSAFRVPGFFVANNDGARILGAAAKNLPGDKVPRFRTMKPELLIASGKSPPATEQPTDPPHWTEDFMKFLQTASEEPLGSYATARRLNNLPFLFPMISVEGVGEIPVPLVDSVSEQLKSVARKAPFGVGSETHVDDKVRNCWEIDAAQVSVMQSAELKKFFAEVVRECCYELGISNESFRQRKIRANLYKMLLYEKGGHFVPHRDSEKQDGMFGTLILQLPSAFLGGVLTVKHDGKELHFDQSDNSAATVHVTAFYADCEHQLHPITSGRRFCLVYNLVSASVAHPPSNVINEHLEAELYRFANLWKGSKIKGEMKLGYPLKHFYTPKNFSFNSMKGQDAHLLTALTTAKSPQGQPIFDVWLVLMERLIIRDDSFYEDQIHAVKLLDKHGKDMKVTTYDSRWIMIQRPDGWMVTKYSFDEYIKEEKLEKLDKDDMQDEYNWVRRSLYSRAFKFDVTEETQRIEFIGNEGVPQELWYHAGVFVISPSDMTAGDTSE